VAGHDYDLARRAASWPLREVLLAYLHQIREAEIEAYKVQVLTWASRQSTQKPPAPPPEY
jgi:hypothetical protein